MNAMVVSELQPNLCTDADSVGGRGVAVREKRNPPATSTRLEVKNVPECAPRP